MIIKVSFVKVEFFKVSNEQCVNNEETQAACIFVLIVDDIIYFLK